MFVRLYISVGVHVCDFKHHILTHAAPTVSILADHTKENTILSILIDALADLGSYNSSLGTLRLWVFFQLSPIILNLGEVRLKVKNANTSSVLSGIGFCGQRRQQEFTW